MESSQDSEPATGYRTYMGDEHGTLYGSNLNQRPWLYQDDRWWIRWPACFVLWIWHATLFAFMSARLGFLGIGVQTLRIWRYVAPFVLGDVMHLFLVFAVLGILSWIKRWSLTLIFVLNLLALPGLDALLNSSAERVFRLLPESLLELRSDILPNLLTLIVSPLTRTAAKCRC